MREKDLPFDRTKHVCYTRNAKKCVQKLLRRYYDEAMAAELWEKIQLQYCEYLKDEPALGSAKITVSIYDPILIFAWYAIVPDKPPHRRDPAGCLRLHDEQLHRAGEALQFEQKRGQPAGG